MAKKTIIELDKTIIKELGERNTTVYERGNNWVVEVPEEDESDAIEIIEDAGWEILDQEFFCGSSYDGFAFTIK